MYIIIMYHVFLWPNLYSDGPLLFFGFILTHLCTHFHPQHFCHWSDAFVLASRNDDLSLFMPTQTVKRDLVQMQTLENRMLQRVALYYTQVLC